MTHRHGRGVQIFSSGARFKITGAPRSEAEGFLRREAPKGEGVGEGVTTSHRWGSGGPPPGNFLENCPKMVRSGVFSGS